MTALHLISDENLISARSYGIELDIEGACAALASQVEHRQGAPCRTMPDHALLRCQASMFKDILVHMWPAPQDPVLADLLACARLGLDYVETLRADPGLKGEAPGVPAPAWPCRAPGSCR